MTAVSGIVDYKQWKSLYNTNTTNSSSKVTTSGSKEIPNDSYQSSKETCTDGKDDGKIGFFQIIYNAGKGIVKTVTNGIKSMVTDSEGHFSLGKTLLSVGTAALCVAFPAVGLVACGIGAVAGAVQVGKGVYNAVTADTDAEAKEAWQNIGGGAFTVGMSIAGAKASYKAMKTSAGAESALAKYETNNKLDFSKVKDNKVQYAKDLWNDAKLSTKNNFQNIKSGVSSKISEIKGNKQDAKLTKEYDSLVKEANKNGDWSKADEFKNQHPDICEKYWQSGKGAETKLNEAVKNGDANAINAQIEYMGEPGQKAALSIMKKAANSKNSAVKELALEYIKTNKQPSEFASFFKALSQDMKTNGRIKTLTARGQKILDSLSAGVSPDSLIAQYGYNNVIQVMAIAADVRITDELI